MDQTGYIAIRRGELAQTNTPANSSSETAFWIDWDQSGFTLKVQAGPNPVQIVARLSSSHTTVPFNDLIVVAVAKAWDEELDPAAWQTDEPHGEQGHRLLVSYSGFYRDTWYDGPLASGHDKAGFTSFLPSGGGGALWLPRTSNTASGISFAHAMQLEGTSLDRAHRCLLAAVTTKLRLLRFESDASFALTDINWSVQDAVLLAVARQSDPKRRWHIISHQRPSPAFRRFCQNIGVTVTPHSPPNAQLTTLMPLRSLLKQNMTTALIHEINRISPVIPPSLGGFSP